MAEVVDELCNRSVAGQAAGLFVPEPAKLAAMAKSGFEYLGYGVTTNAVGASFTTGEFLTDYPSKWAVYVHSHGDVYWDLSKGSPNVNSAFIEDAGVCPTNMSTSNQHRVLASQIKAKAQPPYNIVILSTCRLGWQGITPGGTLANNLPDAFGFAYNASTGYYTKTSTSNQFYLANQYYSFDGDQDTFETNFWYEIKNGGYWKFINYWTPVQWVKPTLVDAFTYAKNSGGFSNGPTESYQYSQSNGTATRPTWRAATANPYTPVWFGNPNYDGTPG